MENAMLCQSIKTLNDINLKDYIAEEKMDGERIVIMKEGSKVLMINRRGLEKGFVYYEIANELKDLPFDFIIDTEVITTDGIFNSLQHRSGLRDTDRIQEASKTYPIRAMIFDVISFNGIKLVHLPIQERKTYLKNFTGLKTAEVICSVSGEVSIKELWLKMVEENKEGIILKRLDSSYVYRRSWDWIKYKNFKEAIYGFRDYELNNAGIKLISPEVEVQVQGRANQIVEILSHGEIIKVNIQYLDKTKAGRLRMPTCKEVIGIKN